MLGFPVKFGEAPCRLTRPAPDLGADSDAVLQELGCPAEEIAGLREAAKGYSNIIVDIRGKGMLIAMEFPNDQLGFELSKAMLERGVLVSGTLVNARVIRVEPPLTLTEEQGDTVCKALADSLAAVSKGL